MLIEFKTCCFKVLKFSQDQQLPKKLPVKYELVTNLKKLAKVEKELVNVKRFTYDFETTGLKFNQHDVVMVGFCPKPGRVIIIPRLIYTQEHFTAKWTEEEVEYAEKISRFVKANMLAIDDSLKRIFSSPALKIAHNGKFDNKFARHFGYPVKKFFFDTVIGHALVNENLPHNLTFLLEWYGINHLSDDDYGPYENDLWFYVNKTKQNKKPFSFVPVKKLASYLAKDCDGDYRLYQKLKPEVKRGGFWKLMMKQQMVVSDIMTEVEFSGFKLDVEGLQEISRKFSFQLEKIETSLKKLAGPDFNPASSKQVLEYLESKNAPFDEVGKKTRGGSYSTDEDALKMMARKRKFKKFCNLILDHREIAKMKGTYLDGKDGASGMLKHVGPTGKVHANWNIHTPRTGRLSANDPSLQVLPRPSVKYPWANIRRLFIPSRPDWVVWEADFCLHGDTKIRLANGKNVKIKNLVGEKEFYLYGYNKDTDKVDLVKGCKARRTSFTDKVVEIKLNTGKKIVSTLDHKFMLKDGRRFEEAQNLKPGDSLLSVNFLVNRKWKKYFGTLKDLKRFARINHSIVSVRIKKLKNPMPMYCLTVPGYHNFFLSNGILSKNCQLEMRIAAWSSRDKIMVQEIRDRVDFHTRNAILFNEELGFLESARGISEDEYKKRMKYQAPPNWEKLSDKKKQRIDDKLYMAREYTETRVFAKELGFGVGYGMDAKTLADNHNKPVDEVEEAINVYFRKYEGYDRWREKQKKLWLSQGFQTLPWTGRKRRFHMAAEWFNSHYSEDCWKRQMDMEATDRQAMNFPIQGFANEVFTRGKIRLRNSLRDSKFKSRILLSLHDGIIGEGPLHEMIRLEELCKESMEVTLSPGKKHEVKLDVDFEVYDRWKGDKIDHKKVTRLRKAF
jgi:DNA polymerase I-like protein with 3'-5' exonuclease and polymerase domains